MPSKKPPAPPSVPAKLSTKPPARQSASANAPKARQQPDNRWQRSKRYGWDSR